MIFNRQILKGAAVAVLALLASVRAASAQQVAQMGTTDLKNEASALVDEKKYIEARPYILELVKRIKDSDDQNLKKELEQMYYFEAFGSDSGGVRPKRLRNRQKIFPVSCYRRSRAKRHRPQLRASARGRRPRQKGEIQRSLRILQYGA